MKGARIGDTVLVKAATDKVGKSLAFLNVQIVNKENGSVLVQGSFSFDSSWLGFTFATHWYGFLFHRKSYKVSALANRFSDKDAS